MFGIYIVMNYNSIPSPHPFVINIDARTDRMNEFTEEFMNWPVPVERVSAVKLSPGWKGCSASHLKCIQIAKERNYPWVIILEDDCVLRPGAIQRFQEVLPFLWKNRHRWDIYNGGIAFIKKHTRISQSPSIYEVYGEASQFCLIHNASYDRILNDHPKDVSEYKTPIDTYYSDKFRIWTSTPYISRQRVGTKSDIEGHTSANWESLFDEAEARLINS